MQTFLPYSDFMKSAKCLDYRRLGKQRVEAFQILKALNSGKGGWINHPAVKMWRGYRNALILYKNTMIEEWVFRGYNNSMEIHSYGEIRFPPWLGDHKFHAAHRSNLLRKDPIWYGQFGWTEDPDLDYIWPI